MLFTAMEYDTETILSIMDGMLWLHRITFGIGYIIEILITLVFITNFLQKNNSDLSSAYFILFFSTLIFDLPLLVIRYPVNGYVWYFFNAIFNLNEDYANSYFTYVKSYFSFCQLIMTINRFTGILYPIKHQRIWSKRNVFLSIFLTFILLLIYHLTAIIIIINSNDYGYYLNLFERLYYDIIISSIAEIMSLFLSIIIFYKINPCSNKANSSHLVRKAEIRLFYVSLFINFMSAIRTLFDIALIYFYYNIYNQSLPGYKYKSVFQGASEFAYFLQHYIGIIVFICTSSQLRTCVFKFYFIDKLIDFFKKHFSTSSIQSTPSVSNDSLFYRRQQQN